MGCQDPDSEQEGWGRESEKIIQSQVSSCTDSEWEVFKVSTLEKAWNRISQFKGGQLKQHAEFWKTLTSDPEILKLVHGVKLDFTIQPAMVADATPYRFQNAKACQIDNEILKMLRKGVIQESMFEEGQVISKIFTRDKKDGSIRVILDLSDLNKHVEYQHFKMDTLEAALNLVNKDAYMCSVDWKDAYYTVPVDQQYRKYLKFRWRDKWYCYTAMPNGLCSAPRLFTKLTKVLLSALRKQGHQIVAYIDDCLIVGFTQQDCRLSVSATAEISEKAGFILHPEKSILEPTQNIVFLGVVIDSVSMTVYLTMERKAKLQQLVCVAINKVKLSIQAFAELIGTMVASFPAVEYAKLFYRRCDNLKTQALKQSRGNYKKEVCITPECMLDLYWWRDNINTAFTPIVRPPAGIVLSSDASKIGWGGTRGSVKTGGHWTTDEAISHINELEIKAALFTLQALCKDVRDTHVLLRIDNTTAVCYINAMGGRKRGCNDITRKILMWCKDRNIWVTAAYLPGEQNVEADAQSRLIHENTEWSLNQDVFNQLCELWGKPEVDLFASRINYKLKPYCSWKPDPGAEVVDAFSISWHHMFVYAFPPFSLIGRVLRKIQYEKTKAILIIPLWPTQHWFSKVTHMLVDFPVVLHCRSGPLLFHPSKSSAELPKMRVAAVLLSGDRQIVNQFQGTPLLQPHGEIPQLDSTRFTFVNGSPFVMRGVQIPMRRIK